MSKARYDGLLSALHSLCARLLFFLSNYFSKVITFFVLFLRCELIEFNFGLAFWIDNFVNLCVNITQLILDGHLDSLQSQLSIEASLIINLDL